ncbi:MULTISPECIES: cation:proton antiporter [Archaeoglobus]|jgi:CPA2 family monovalent cation:H+ antiporter-2|uniref:Na+/H+ antiporter (NapA-2) n=3 Tax=Archaeoglobus fulgidus TaxID=2234 RepID=O29023_ARCFU|nr:MULTISPECIES: cation:proton antiporter [Archaeoglobus]AAB89998.1 Na+/H+ antiporter (napA-2) [Archaeoglobus fulgidus DSM 4304]AIG98116.1 Kef-type K+ transport system, membrane component [Archaeoglobus fulgidus DSM 8774]KUJ93122.1 MAG: Na+/H+ antiporter (NapA-2) [Archaeoglobus fulgidus]KUK06204.1 MAG: Na+/H+ antiporter (NapA-2) [Archaeoglobus fulgidus]MDI3498750.1 monovalent cation:H+ antiporter-2, family [Archaeoglobus sp.]
MELAVIVFAAAIAAIISRMLRITPIPAYILVGMALGKAGWHLSEVEFLGKLGIVFLLFYVGLKIPPSTIKKTWQRTLKSGTIDFLFNFLPPLVLLYLIGFDLRDAFILASAIYISSSAINLKMLVDDRKLVFTFAEVVVLLMVFEDIVLVALLFLFSASEPLTLLYLALIALTALALYAISPQIEKLMSREDEVPYLLTFSIPSISLFLAEKFRISEALMAILFGVALNRLRIDKMLVPFKEVFLAVFFVFFGTMVDLHFSYLSLLLIAVAVIGKLAGAYFIARFTTSKSDAVEVFKYTLARGEFTVIFPALFAPEFATTLAAVVLFTSIAGSLIAKL